MNAEFLEGFVEECIKQNVPEHKIEELFKQAVHACYLREKDPDFAEGFLETLTKESRLTQKDAEEILEKSAALPVGAMMSPGRQFLRSGADLAAQAARGAWKHKAPLAITGALGALLAGPSWRNGALANLREKFMFWNPRDAVAAGEEAGGTAGLDAMQELIRSTGGDITKAWSQPGKTNTLMQRLLRSQTGHTNEIASRGRQRRMGVMDSMRGDMGAGFGGVGPYNYNPAGMMW